MITRKTPVVALLLAFLAMAPFLAGGGLRSFVAFDDDVFVFENPAVINGLTPSGVRWAFSAQRVSSWHPLTWIAHMTVVSLFGLDPWWHHLVNILLHAISTVLLFTAVRRMTGALWRSALVAALFAVHPLHVESVAWVSELKDVLSGLFFTTVLLAYERYARRGGTGRYLLVFLLLGLGLLAKPMLVTVPLVLLLLDFWPLGRLRVPAAPAAGSALLRLAAEKTPLLLLSVASSTATIFAGLHGGAISSLGELPLATRIANALVAHALYLGKTFWPRALAVYYPHPESYVWWKTAGAALLLTAATAAAARWFRRRPYALFGWLWFVVMLSPVAGIVQSGAYAMADRYTYLPLIGIFVVIVWGLADAGSHRRLPRFVPGAVAAVAVTALAVLATFQAQLWRDSESLFTHTLAVTADNWMIQNNLGVFYEREGRLAEAEARYREALRINPLFVNAYANLGSVLLKRGRDDDALTCFLEALRRAPDDARAHYNTAVLLAARGSVDEAVPHYRDAIRLSPDFAEARTNLAVILEGLGQTAEAEALHRESVRLRPDLPQGRHQLGTFLAEAGRLDEAQTELSGALRLRPDDAEIHFSLGAVLAAQGRLDDASDQFRQTLRLDPVHEGARQGLNAIQAFRGRTPIPAQPGPGSRRR